MTNHWYIIASRDTVKVFIRDEQSNKFTLLRKLENLLGREKNRSLIRKQSSLGMRSVGRFGKLRYSETKRNDPHEIAAVQFARVVADFLESERQKKSFQVLTITAEPHFLGRLREELSKGVHKSVKKWVNKDLQKIPQNRLSKILNTESQELGAV